MEDYGSIATVANVDIRGGTQTQQGGWLNVGSDGDLTITYTIDNPGNHRLRAIVLPLSIDFTPDFPEDVFFLRSTFSLKISGSDLDAIDGKSEQCNISPTVILYRADFGEEERIQSQHTIALRCNTPPKAVEAAVGQKIPDETLVLAIKLPTLKDDDKYLIVSALGQTHTFSLPISNGNSSAGWTISSTAPANMEKTWDNGPSAPAGANCYITTNINIKNRAAFAVHFTLQDELGLTSQTYTLNPSHGAQLSPPYHTTPGNDDPSITLAQDESDGMATYILRADAGTIHYTVSQTSGGSHTYSGSGASPLAIKLPAGEFSVSAVAKAAGFEDSEEFTQDITVTPSIFFVSASGNDTSGDGSKSNPFATITKAQDSFGTLAAGSTPKIFILSNLAINSPVTLSKNLLLQGAAGGTKGSRVTLTASLASSDTAFAISGDVEMNAITLSQASSTSIASGINIASTGSLSLGNVTVTGMDTTSGAVVVEGTLTLKAPGNVKITGNTSSGKAKNVYLPEGKTINITAGSLTGSQIGVFTEEKPDDTKMITITTGYGTAGYKATDLKTQFQCDEYYEPMVSSGEVVLTINGGGDIDTSPNMKIVFSFSNTDSTKGTDSGNGTNIQIYAFGDGTLLNISDFTTLTAKITYYTGHYIKGGNLKTENPFSLGVNDAGIYRITIEGTYKNGQSADDELDYTITSQP
ncbi:MAG: hypothetical protein J1E59_01265 [Treponema sp.]|nr:hypothetical protein [Treponema sp.]